MKFNSYKILIFSIAIVFLACFSIIFNEFLDTKNEARNDSGKTLNSADAEGSGKGREDELQRLKNEPPVASESKASKAMTSRQGVFGKVEPRAVSTEGSQGLSQADEEGEVSLAVRETMRGGLEERSGLAAPGPYEHSVYLSDPEAYVQKVVPGRIHQTAIGAKDIPSLQALSSQILSVRSLGSLDIQVRAKANAPVTFQTHGLGAFANGRTTQTVSSDDQGIASVTWTAIRGTVGDVVVVAACPLAVGQTRFHIEVL